MLEIEQLLENLTGVLILLIGNLLSHKLFLM
jgi:hypothetical protein